MHAIMGYLLMSVGAVEGIQADKQYKFYKVAEVQVSYRPDYNITELPQITSSNQTFQLFK